MRNVLYVLNNLKQVLYVKKNKYIYIYIYILFLPIYTVYIYIINNILKNEQGCVNLGSGLAHVSGMANCFNIYMLLIIRIWKICLEVCSAPALLQRLHHLWIKVAIICLLEKLFFLTYFDVWTKAGFHL